MLLFLFQGDGESAPDTPPPEFAPDSKSSDDDISKEKLKLDSHSKLLGLKSKKTDLQNGKKAGNGVGAHAAPFVPDVDLSVNLNVKMDLIPTLLFVVSFATRLWRLDTPRGVV